MYEAFWSLKQSPFRESRNAMFHESPQHEEALARLLFLVEERRTCGLLTGPGGTGKSMLLKLLENEVRRSGVRCVPIDLAAINADMLNRELLAGLGVTAPQCSRACQRRLMDVVLETAEWPNATVFLFDQLQDASENLSTGLHSLVRGVRRAGNATCLFATRSDRFAAEWSWLRDEVELRAELGPFDQDETQRFVTDLLTQSGAGEELFQPDALSAVQKISGGIPWKINRLCDLTLLSAMHDSAKQINAEHVSLAQQSL